MYMHIPIDSQSPEIFESGREAAQRRVRAIAGVVPAQTGAGQAIPGTGPNRRLECD